MNLHNAPDFERHRYSQITEPYDRNDVMYFDVTFTAQYPDDDEGAEQLRLDWLEAWLDQRKICQQGFEIVDRREFETLEYNAANHDIRYEFKCLPRPVG